MLPVLYYAVASQPPVSIKGKTNLPALTQSDKLLSPRQTFVRPQSAPRLKRCALLKVSCLSVARSARSSLTCYAAHRPLNTDVFIATSLALLRNFSFLFVNEHHGGRRCSTRM